MRVNQIFHAFAARHVSRKCGTNFGPWAIDLAKLATHPIRLQQYANCIQELYLVGEEKVARKKDPALPLRVVLPEVAALFERVLPAIDFPHLRSISVDRDYFDKDADLELMTLPYLGYALKALTFHALWLSPMFWKALEVNRNPFLVFHYFLIIT